MKLEPGESLFISDLHLAPERPETIALFLAFLERRAPAAARLLILGDLFETWIGDDDNEPAYLEVQAALRRLTASGTDCFVIRGNRDFLLGADFCRATGCRLLRDPEVCTVAEEPVLLMHGDLLCTDDVAYQRFRRRIRNPVVTWLFQRKSLASRRAIAADYRRKSGDATSTKTTSIMDVAPETVEAFLLEHKAVRLIHGHTHRAADHAVELGDRVAIRSVLAEWHGSGGEVLVHDGLHWSRETVG